MAVGEQNQKSVRRISTISDMRAVTRELSPFVKRKTRLQNQQFSGVTLKIYKNEHYVPDINQHTIHDHTTFHLL